MDDLRQYIICITTAAIVVGVLSGLTDRKGASGTIFRLIAGLFLAFMVIHPLIQLDFEGLEDWSDVFDAQSRYSVAVGEKLAADAMGDIIKSRAQAYILDKAQTYDAELTVEVTLNKDQIPNSVRLSGRISPYGKRQLQQVLTEELGIMEENQIWTG